MISDTRPQTLEDLHRFIAGGDTDKQIKYAHRLAQGLERTGAARELTVEAMITELACAGHKAERPRTRSRNSPVLVP